MLLKATIKESNCVEMNIQNMKPTRCSGIYWVISKHLRDVGCSNYNKTGSIPMKGVILMEELRISQSVSFNGDTLWSCLHIDMMY